MLPRFVRSISSPVRTGAACGVAAFLAVVVSLDAGGDYPGWPEGPGLTIDESFNVQQGVRLVVAGKGWLLGALTWQEVFGGPEELGANAPAGYHLPDHPPLGRLWLGLFHELVVSIAPPRDHPGPFVTTAARVGSAATFAATVFLIAATAGRWYGVVPGVVAAISLMLMPRVFGHAHLAALETTIGLAYAASLLSVANSWDGDLPPSTRTALWTGLVFGAALLTKIQAIFLPVAVGLWALGRWRAAAIRPLLIWGVAGVVTLFVFWPWLWFDPIRHFLAYLGRATDRVALHVYYLGRAELDRDVPWHYPWVLFAATLPLPVLLAGIGGCLRGRTGDDTATPRTVWSGSRERLILLAILVPLVVFSVPGVAVYDGARLFLVDFPLWALFVGRAAALVMQWLAQDGPSVANARRRRITAWILAGTVTTWCVDSLVRFAPCWLSEYGGLVGGASGAERIGLETNYWGDSITRELLLTLCEKVPEGSKVAVTPVLHQFQLPEMIAQSPPLRRHRIELTPFDPGKPSEYLLMFVRKADLPANLAELTANAEVLGAVERGGVRLAVVYRLKRVSD